MHVVELKFECFDNTTMTAAEKAINGLLRSTSKCRFQSNLSGSNSRRIVEIVGVPL